MHLETFMLQDISRSVGTNAVIIYTGMVRVDLADVLLLWIYSKVLEMIWNLFQIKSLNWGGKLIAWEQLWFDVV